MMAINEETGEYYDEVDETLPIIEKPVDTVPPDITQPVDPTRPDDLTTPIDPDTGLPVVDTPEDTDPNAEKEGYIKDLNTGKWVTVASAEGKAAIDLAALQKSLPEKAWESLKSAFTKDGSTDWKKLMAVGGGLGGLATSLLNKDKPAPITGYQGKIPTLNAVQQQVPGAYDPTRRPGSSGQRYLTDMKYADPAAAAAAQTAAGEQATGLAALNAANPAMQKIQKSPEGKVIPDSMVSKPYAAPASSVIDRLAPTMKGLASLTDAKNVITSTDDGWKMPLNKESAPTDINAQSGGIGSITPSNQTVAQPAAPGKYDSPTAQNPNPGMIAIDDPVYRKGNSSNFLSSLFDASKRTPNPNAQPITYEDNYASGGGITALKRGNYLSGPTDGMADKLPANIEGNQEARLSHGEFVIPADVVSHLGNGNSDAGAERLYSMMDKIRKARTGTKKQGKQINPNKFLPGGLVGYAGGGDVKHFLTGGVTPPANAIGAESNLSNWAGDYVTGMLGKGQALAAAPYQAYGGPLTAGQSAGQTAAFDASAGLNVPTSQMGAFTPQTFTADQAQNYMNPYLSAALNPQMEEMRRQSQLNLQPNMAKLTQAGGFGGSRQALLESESNRNLQTQQNAELGKGYQTAFDKAMGQFNTEQNRGLESQRDTNAYGLQALQKQADLGGQQRAIEQEGITADKAQFEEEKKDPYKKIEFQKALLEGLPVQAQSNNYQQPSALASLLGGASNMTDLYKLLFPDTASVTTVKK